MSVSALLLMAACGSSTPPQSPTPVPAPDAPTANVYILPGAEKLGPNAFGDEDIRIFKGERMRWRNIDGVEHNVVADMPALPEFTTTGLLAPGGERSFPMNTLGATTVHCTIHPQMTGRVVVQER
jgi:plastocyanin